jgi:hypothetical protein
MCRICDTTAPTKEGLLWDDKIVSNLHEQMFCGDLQVSGALGINGTRQYGARHFESRVALIAFVRHCHPR